MGIASEVTEEVEGPLLPEGLRLTCWCWLIDRRSLNWRRLLHSEVEGACLLLGRLLVSLEGLRCWLWLGAIAWSCRDTQAQ